MHKTWVLCAPGYGKSYAKSYAGLMRGSYGKVLCGGSYARAVYMIICILLAAMWTHGVGCYAGLMRWVLCGQM